jgi:hypothetical protein
VERRPSVDRATEPSNSRNWTADWINQRNLDRENGFKRRENQQPRDRPGRLRAILDSSESY